VDLDGLYARLITSGRRDGAGGLSLRTVRYIHTIMRKALGDADRKGLVQRNVARYASPPAHSATRAPEMSIWSPTELRDFLESVADHRHAALFRLAAMSGLRRGELLGLRWVDVDLENGSVSVRQAVTEVNGTTVTGDVKTKRSRRVVSLDAATVASLRQRRAAQIEHRLLIGSGWRDSGLVFTSPTGEPWLPESISQAFERAEARVRLPRIRFHDLRHTHASHLLAAGVNVKVVSERLGHGSVGFTLDVYAHVMPGQQADAAAAVARLVDAP
jgi:integrase